MQWIFCHKFSLLYVRIHSLTLDDVNWWSCYLLFPERVWQGATPAELNILNQRVRLKPVALCCAVLLLQFWVGTYKTASLLTCLAESIALSLDCAAAHVLLQQISLDGAVPFKGKTLAFTSSPGKAVLCTTTHKPPQTPTTYSGFIYFFVTLKPGKNQYQIILLQRISMR